jgi:hypothetical protein
MEPKVVRRLLAAGDWPATVRLWAWPTGDLAFAGRPFSVEARALGPHPIRMVQLHYRPIGTSGVEPWQVCACSQVRGAVYRGTLPAELDDATSFVYYLSAEDDRGVRATLPAEAPTTLFSATVIGG